MINIDLWLTLLGSRREYHQNGVVGTNESPRVHLKMQSARAVALLEDLRVLLKDNSEDNARRIFTHLPTDMQEFLTHWIPQHSHSQVSSQLKLSLTRLIGWLV